MARQYAPLLTEIWNDKTFVSLSSQAQRLYLLAISQPNITWAGVVPFTARRWAKLAPDTTAKVIVNAATELAKSGLVVLDADTEELWVRSFIKHNAQAQPKLRKAAEREYREIHSSTIQRAAHATYPWLAHDGEQQDGQTDGHDDGHHEGHSQESEKLCVGVGVQGSVSLENPSTENTNTNTNTELRAEVETAYAAEAERQAAAWLHRDPLSIVDRPAWVAKRIRTLKAQYGIAGPPIDRKDVLGPHCVNPDCRDGFDCAEQRKCDSCEQMTVRAS